MQIQLTTEELERFWSYVDRSGGPDACHPWTGYRLPRGYGQFWVAGRKERAHRVAWCLAGHEITEERPCVLHHCDNPPCCNEPHLWDGTHADNARDRARKWRGGKSKKGLPFGVFVVRDGSFGAQVHSGGKYLYLGTYDTAEEASAVAVETKQGLFKRPLTFPAT